MLSRRRSQHNVLLDQAAIALSALCVLHCLMLPLLLLGVPAVSALSVAGGEHFHAAMLAFAIPVSLVALGMGFRRHGNRSIVFFGFVGIAMLLIGATIMHDLAAEWPEIVVTLVGSFTLAYAHWLNLRRGREFSQSGDA